MNNSVLIKKYSGEYEAFDVNKLINSLRRSQANEGIIQGIAGRVQEQIEEGMSTKKIYQLAFSMLKAKSKGVDPLGKDLRSPWGVKTKISFA